MNILFWLFYRLGRHSDFDETRYVGSVQRPESILGSLNLRKLPVQILPEVRFCDSKVILSMSQDMYDNPPDIKKPKRLCFVRKKGFSPDCVG